MNIFVVNADPVLAAQDLCDKHIVKMILESAQMLSTIHRLCGSTSDLLYKPTHANHPCTIWARTSTANYRWLYQHFIALSLEYTFRFNKQHKSYVQLRRVLEHPPVCVPDGALTPFAQAMPAEYCSEDAVQAYRRYYAVKKQTIDMKYTNRNQPSWLNSGE